MKYKDMFDLGKKSNLCKFTAFALWLSSTPAFSVDGHALNSSSLRIFDKGLRQACAQFDSAIARYRSAAFHGENELLEVVKGSQSVFVQSVCFRQSYGDEAWSRARGVVDSLYEECSKVVQSTEFQGVGKEIVENCEQMINTHMKGLQVQHVILNLTASAPSVYRVREEPVLSASR
ncbi:hypothetical protein SAMN02745166_03483 [Prosthecobacter debontii]|uniref:Uncharacterized protein n=1 Tax=Prosthecobacter debontii TaxID=48467 RepID=A0A1T4YJ91_9BACT|nr:hypothetical protein [Prosthecobacter debontii]SKB01852.1 hypothetical protein SAMN02745166_03483 [Prosthecobacter debontii]